MQKLIEVAKKSTCLIKIGNRNGTGFFVRFNIPSEEKPMLGLITNNHVLNSSCLKSNKSFKICINDQFFNINLNNDNFKFTSELIDVTFVQFTENEFINNKDITFLNPNLGDIKNKSIYIVQYPLGQILSYASGTIESVLGFNYFHTASTMEGSSGSPLINENMECIGIHKSVMTPLYNVYIYKYPYYKSSLFLLFYRTNYAWYCTSKKLKHITYDISYLKTYKWNLINIYKPIEKIISNIDKYYELKNEHKIIIMWLKLSEL